MIICLVGLSSVSISDNLSRRIVVCLYLLTISLAGSPIIGYLTLRIVVRLSLSLIICLLGLPRISNSLNICLFELLSVSVSANLSRTIVFCMCFYLWPSVTKNCRLSLSLTICLIGLSYVSIACPIGLPSLYCISRYICNSSTSDWCIDVCLQLWLSVSQFFFISVSLSGFLSCPTIVCHYLLVFFVSTFSMSFLYSRIIVTLYCQYRTSVLVLLMNGHPFSLLFFWSQSNDLSLSYL
jgi:hypothetical protein